MTQFFITLMTANFNAIADTVERNPKLGMGLPLMFGTISAAGAGGVAEAFFMWTARVGILFGAIGAILAVLIHVRNLTKKDK